MPVKEFPSWLRTFTTSDFCWKNCVSNQTARWEGGRCAGAAVMFPSQYWYTCCLLSAVCCLLTIACYQFAPGGAGRDNEGAPVCLGFSGFENNCLAKLISLLWLHTRPCHDTDKSISRIEKTYFNLVSWLRLNGSEWGQHFVLTVATRSLCILSIFTRPHLMVW